MGACLSCFNVADAEGNEASDNSNHRNRMLPNGLIQNLRNKCGALLGGVEIHASPTTEAAASSSSFMTPDSSQLADDHPCLATNTKVKKLESQKNLAGKSANLFHLGPNLLSRITLQMGSKLVIKDESRDHHSEEDEDVCPTCLEEYTLENPKVRIQCQHSYHLSCIYEWMERSEKCPFCGKLMLFDETT